MYRSLPDIRRSRRARNYFGDGSLGYVKITNTGATQSFDGVAYTAIPGWTLAGSVVSIPATQDGDMVVLHCKSWQCDAGMSVTTSNRCRGLLIYVQGNCVHNGVGTMAARGPKANPADATTSAYTPVAPTDGHAVPSEGITIRRLSTAAANATVITMAAEYPLIASQSAYGGYSVRQVVRAAEIVAVGNRVRVKFRAYNTVQLVLAHASIGVRTSGYNTSAVPTPLTFGGAAGVSIPAGQYAWSDWLDMPITAGVDYVVIMDMTTAAYVAVSSTTTYESAHKAGATWDQASPSGMTANGRAFIEALQVSTSMSVVGADASATLMHGCGSAAVSAEANQPEVIQGVVLRIPRIGGIGGNSSALESGRSVGGGTVMFAPGGGGSGQNDPNGSGKGGAGSAATCFGGGGGGAGGDDAYSGGSAAPYVGAGGAANAAGSNRYAGAGAGNPAGTGGPDGYNTPADEGTGGLLIAIIGGSLSGSGRWVTRGSDGGDVLATANDGGGGASGGGVVAALVAGSLAGWTGTLSADGGLGGTCADYGTRGGDGGLGSVIGPLPIDPA